MLTPQQEAAMRQALEALKQIAGAMPFPVGKQAITALTAALADNALDKKAENARELGLDYAPAQQEPVAHSIVAGALFDFMGWLTSRKERLVLSSVNDASPAVEVIKQFAEMRCLSLDEANVKEWQEHLYTRPQAREPVIDKSAAIRIATALGWEPKRQPLTDEEISKIDWKQNETLHDFARAIEAAHGIKGDA